MKDKIIFVLTITNVYTLSLAIIEHIRVKKCLKMIDSNIKTLDELHDGLINIINKYKGE